MQRHFVRPVACRYAAEPRLIPPEAHRSIIQAQIAEQTIPATHVLSNAMKNEMATSGACGWVKTKYP